MMKKQRKFRVKRGSQPRRLILQPASRLEPDQEASSGSPRMAQVEAALNQAQALFEKLFEATPDANLLIDQQGIILLANHQAEKIFGYRKEELIGMPVENLVPPEARDKHVGQRQRYQKAPRARPMGAGLDLYALRKNGTSFPVDIILSPIEAVQGPFTLCVIHDITLQVASQKALQEQTALVQLVQEISAAANTADSIKVLFQYAIDRLCAYLEWPVGHAWLVENRDILVTMDIWSTGMPPAMNAMREATGSMHFTPGMGLPGTVLDRGQPLWLVHPVDRANFHRKEPAQKSGIKTAMAFPVLAGKEIVAIFEFFSDKVVEPQQNLLAVLPNIGAQLGRVVERSWAENTLLNREMQLRTLISNLPVILWMVDKEGRFTMFEGKGIPGIGMQPGEIVGDSIFERLKDYPEMTDYVRKALAGQEIHFEYRSTAGVVYDTYFSPYRDREGNLAGAIGMALDVSERHRMEAELDEMRHHLMESVEIERLRLAQQLHDGPLQDLYGVFYQIQEIKNGLQDEARQALESPLQTIEQVNDTLRFICGELRPTTLVHLGLNKAITSHAERIREKAPGLVLHFNLADDAQSLEPGIRMGLYRIYQNLITNIIRHSQARHAWVRLDLAPDHVIFEVQDNGKGFQVPDNMIQLVRQGRFGLATTLERVEAMNGTLDIKSRPGMGTLVRVSVPRKQALPA